jgi:hypothetical protein
MRGGDDVLAGRDAQNDMLAGVDAIDGNTVQNDADGQCRAEDTVISYLHDLCRLAGARHGRRAPMRPCVTQPARAISVSAASVRIFIMTSATPTR